MKLVQAYTIFFCLSFPSFILGQDVELFQQFNGRYDYTAIGNTLNPAENNLNQAFCQILPSSQATLNLSTDATVIAAYLYWAGSGLGDTSVTLNGTDIEADETYNVSYDSGFPFGVLPYFSCYANITDLIISEGNTVYELTNMDISQTLIDNAGYCENRTNFGGWAIYIIYEDDSLPLNQISLFQGLEIIDRNVSETTIVLDNLNVIDNQNAKLGFLAWEGDNALNFGESISINNNVIESLPLNPATNAFNGTNSFTGATNYFNCDLDFYNIQDNIAIGDASAEVRLTTGDFDSSGTFQADLIIINNLILVLNSQLPDATVVLDTYVINCDRELTLNYTVFNTNSTDVLPANTPIAFYADGILLGVSQTQNPIAIDGSESGTVTFTIDESFVDDIELTIIVDDDGTQNGVVTETSETNNTFVETISLLPTPELDFLPNILQCNEGFDSAVFDLVEYVNSELNTSADLSFYTSLEDLEAGENEIFIPGAYNNNTNPQTIFVKVDVPPCFEIYQFEIAVENCPPFVPEGFSPNDDTYNDWFNIQGLYDIFLDHKLIIFNRYGTLIFEGDNSKRWEGKSNRGINNVGKLMPVGTYYYILYLNDPDFGNQQGWVYLNY